MGKLGFAAFAAFALFLSGACWDRDRAASLLALAFALGMVALSLDGCAVYHACREGLCR